MSFNRNTITIPYTFVYYICHNVINDSVRMKKESLKLLSKYFQNRAYLYDIENSRAEDTRYSSYRSHTVFCSCK